jgi:hypothetical protein
MPSIGKAEPLEAIGSDDRTDTSRNPSSGKVKEMIKNGLDDEFRANECGVKIRTVAFIRRQMAASGEA